MATKIQYIINQFRKKKKKKIKTFVLGGCPQKKATCLKVFVTSPKKPNSASRKVVKVVLSSNNRITQCHIPGIKHSLQRYSTVLLRGGRVKDLPAVNYRLVRGKFDLKKVFDRSKGRSKYGIPKL
jgi:small subunit ribosomal protein S12